MQVVQIGRGPQNNVVINDPTVSENHCQITLDDSGSFYIADLNSTNGTWVNGVKIQGSVWLNNEDAVRIGNTNLPWRNYFGAGGNSTPTTQYQGYQQNYSSSSTPSMSKPNNHLTGAILCTIFCCWPFGIPAIVNAAKVDNLWNAGRYDEACEAARKAKSWLWTSFALGLIANLIVVAYYIIVIAAAAL